MSDAQIEALCAAAAALGIVSLRAVLLALRVARANKVIGMPLTQQQCADALGRLGLALSEGQGTITVSPSILVYDDGRGNGWHGFLERGVWRSV